MDLWQLDIFCRVVELEGFSKAANEIHLSQPTVSSHIKELESYFDCRLIDRTEKKAIPTPAGNLLYQYAKKILLLRDQAESAIAEHQGKMSGRLMIGGSTIPGGFILPALIGEFNQDFPDVRISLRISDTETIIDAIHAGNLEMGIVGATSRIKRIEQEKLIEDEMRVIVPGGHPLAGRKAISIEALLQEPFIIRERGSGTLKSIQNSLIQKNLKSERLKIAAELGSTTAVIQGIKAGLGISILSPIAVQAELSEKTLVALKLRGIDLKRQFYLTTRQGRSLSPPAKGFIDFLQKKLAGKRLAEM